jgi:ribosomal protein S18 acetylase RimI-like enzyme
MNLPDLPTPLRLRHAAAGDAPFLAALYRSTRGDLLTLDAEPPFIEQLIAMQQQMQAHGYRNNFPAAEYWLLESGKEAVGRLVLDFGDQAMRLIDIALLPQAQGRGYGSLLLRTLQALASERGQPLRLAVASGNPRARQLYLRLGFVRELGDAAFEYLVWQPAQEGG